MTDATVAADQQKLAEDQQSVAGQEAADAKDSAGQPELDTAVDAQGVTRVAVTTVQDGWEPAPTEPSEEAVAAAEKRNA